MRKLLAFLGVLMVGGYVTMTVGPPIETYINPVYESVVPVDIKTSARDERFRFLIDKARDCQLVSKSWYFGDPNGVFQRVRLVPTDLASGPEDASLPVGLQYSDEYVVDLSTAGSFRKQFGVTVHKCHGLWNQTTIIGPYPLPFPKEPIK